MQPVFCSSHYFDFLTKTLNAKTRSRRVFLYEHRIIRKLIKLKQVTKETKFCLFCYFRVQINTLMYWEWSGIRISFSSLVAFDRRAWPAFLHSPLFCCRLPLPPIRNGNHIGISWVLHGTCFGRFRAISCPRILFSWVQNYQIPNWRLGLSMS